MDNYKLKSLITKNENAKLEFKEQWYHKSQKNEMIKDIIALANGNPQTVGETAYLIIGIEDKTKYIKEVTLDKSIAELEQETLQNINNYATPPITDIFFDFFIVNEKKVLVISIPNHNYLISLSKDLQTKRTDKRGTTFYRERDKVAIASPDIIREFDKKYQIINQYKIKNDRKEIVTIDGLMYQNDILTRDYTYDEAVEYAQNLKLGGYRDWRLPTVEELLILASNEGIEVKNKYHYSSSFLYIDKRFVQSILGKNSPHFWTSNTEYREGERSSFFGLKKESYSYSEVVLVDFNKPKSDFYYYSNTIFGFEKYYVICVRDENE